MTRVVKNTARRILIHKSAKPSVHCQHAHQTRWCTQKLNSADGYGSIVAHRLVLLLKGHLNYERNLRDAEMFLLIYGVSFSLEATVMGQFMFALNAAEEPSKILQSIPHLRSRRSDKQM